MALRLPDWFNRRSVDRVGLRTPTTRRKTEKVDFKSFWVSSYSGGGARSQHCAERGGFVCSFGSMCKGWKATFAHAVVV